MINRIKGNWQTRQVWLDGVEVSPKLSQAVLNHSPDGFNWSYGGSGPAQLALAILMKVTTKQIACQLYQKFKFDFIAKLPPSDFQIDVDIESWIKLTSN